MNIHVVAGPTASGKTKFAIELAQQVNGELINADSRQIYRYLDIGTNKGDVVRVDAIDVNNDVLPVHEIDASGVKIHLLSFLNPDEQFDAHRYRNVVFGLLPQITARNKVPILVGGTGLYIDFIINADKYDTDAGMFDGKLRQDLNGLSVEELQYKLVTLDSKEFFRMNESDRLNPRRLVRRIERLTGSPGKELEGVKYFDLVPEVHYMQLPLAELERRINTRAVQMLQDGLLDEVKHILQLGYRPTAPGLQTIGYKEVLAHLEGKISYDQLIEQIQTAHRQYAKKQMTWFKKYLEAS